MLAPFKPTFRLFVACEDQAALFQARKVEEQVRDICGDEINISDGVWSFALLRSAQLRKQAAAEAADADMIILSLAGRNELPADVKQMLEHLPTRSASGQAALVVLIGNAEDAIQPPSDLRYLKELAEQRGLDFFCNRDGWERLDFSRPSPRAGEIRSTSPESIISPHLMWAAEN